MKRRKTKEERDAQKEQLQTILSNAHESVWYELSKLTEFLQFAAKFPRYSYNNQLLIFAQKPSATAVKSFNAWKEAGRFVKKGEKGIEIFAPIQKTYVRKENEVDDNGNPKLDDEGQPIKKKVCIEYLDYINTNTDAFLFSSIGQLAEHLEISDATVSRFTRHVGCRDFKALKSLVMEQSPGPAAKLAATLRQGEGFSPQAWLERQREYLETTACQLSTEEFGRAVEALCSAQRVFINGKNASASLAQLLHFLLRRLGLSVSLLSSGGSELLEGLFQATAKDLVVLFSFSKLSWEGRILLEHSRAVGYRTLAFVGRTCLPRRSGRLSACSLTGALRRSNTPWRPRRPAGRAGHRCSGTVGSQKCGTPSVAASDEKGLFPGRIKAFPIYAQIWGMLSFDRFGCSDLILPNGYRPCLFL